MLSPETGALPKGKGRKKEPAAPAKSQETQAQALSRIVEELGIRSAPVARNGRPLKASAAVVKGIYNDIKAGMQIDRACILHGVSYATLDQWKRANSDIMRMFEQADAESERELIKAVRDAVGKDWKAANWLLERRHRWEPVSRTELTGKDGAALSVSQQLFASIAKGGDALAKAKPIKNVTPKRVGEQRTNNPVTSVDVKEVVTVDASHDATTPA